MEGRGKCFKYVKVWSDINQSTLLEIKLVAIPTGSRRGQSECREIKTLLTHYKSGTEAIRKERGNGFRKLGWNNSLCAQRIEIQAKRKAVIMA